jgi:copper chaperone CopZ
MKKVKGLESVDVSLNKGEALIRLKPGNSVSVEQIRQVVLDNGFTPRDSDVEVVGRVVERDGKPALAVSGLDLVYLLAGDRSGRGKVEELWRHARGKEVVVRGHLPQTSIKGRAEEPRALGVRDYSLVR